MFPKKHKTNTKHKYFMKLAYNQASRALGNTGKNPAVGCVIVKNNELISLAHTNFNGRPHAERIALSNKKINFKGSLLYSTLEPCSHYGKTSPCTDIIKKKNIKMVYFSKFDPDRRSFKKAKKPIVIIGDSALYGKSGKYVFETLKNFLSSNNFIKKDWNALNILTQQASRVGAIDLGVHSINEAENFSFFNKLDNDDFKFIYLLGADNINFDKKNKFVVYQGSHGDKGAEIADIILPGAAYTEKNGLFINLEGKLQSAYKASYPPGEAREDWIIFKDLSNMMKKPLGYKNVKHLRESINKYIQSDSLINYSLKVNTNLFLSNL